MGRDGVGSPRRPDEREVTDGSGDGPIPSGVLLAGSCERGPIGPVSHTSSTPGLATFASRALTFLRELAVRSSGGVRCESRSVGAVAFPVLVGTLRHVRLPLFCDASLLFGLRLDDER